MLALQSQRRTQLMSAAIALIGGFIVLAIAVPCGAFLISPLRHETKTLWPVVATLSELNDQGTPQRFPVFVPCRNAWTRLPDSFAGDVFLRRVPETGEIVALDAQDWPMGMNVDYDENRRCFRCRCWGLDFDLNGAPMQDWGSKHSMPSVAVRVIDDVISVQFLDER